MNQKFRAFIRTHGISILMIGGLTAYIVIAGTTRSCPACAAITDLIGLTDQPESSVLGTSPQWAVTTIDGTPLSSENLKGKVVIVDFWATWCPPCREEIPGFNALHKTYGEDVVILGISLDEKGVEAVNQFTQKVPVDYSLAMGQPNLFEAFGEIRALPTTFILNKTGTIVEAHVGFTKKSVFEQSIQKLL